MSGLRVCGTCFGLYGEINLRRQLCSCATPEEHRANGEARYRSSGTYWTRLAEICRCCGAALVTADHKYAHWFCGGCLKRVREVNEACGRCAIPVGWHSILNGVFIPSNRCKTLIGATGATDELNAFFRETASVSEWGDRIVERRWLSVGLALGQDVSVHDYLNAVWATRPDKIARFDELVAARGIPPHWRDFQHTPLELLWHEEDKDGLSFLASEEIVWLYPDGEDEFADLTLRVASAGDRWVWEVILDEEAAGENDPLLAHGVATTLETAKTDCDAAAQLLIAEEDARSARREEEEEEEREELDPLWAAYPWPRSGGAEKS